jgi:hypothetical protein
LSIRRTTFARHVLMAVIQSVLTRIFPSTV